MDDCKLIPTLAAPLVDAKRAAEEHLRRSGLAYTILDSALFMESRLGAMLFADTSAGIARVYGNRDVRFRCVAVADVAELVVRCIDHPAASNAAIHFGGPEALTQREAVKQPLVDRLDLERYKNTIKALAQFGDRRHGMRRNRDAVDWIDERSRTNRCCVSRALTDFLDSYRVSRRFDSVGARSTRREYRTRSIPAMSITER